MQMKFGTVRSVHSRQGPLNASVPNLQPRVHGLALQGKDAEDALMHPAQRLPADETLQALDAQGELPESEGPLVAQAPVAQPGDVLLRGVVRAVDDPQILPTSALHGGLGETPLAPEDEVDWLDHHTLAAP